MLKNGLLAAAVQIVLAALACFTVGLYQEGIFLTAFSGQPLVGKLMALLVTWLAGIACFITGYRLKPVFPAGENFLSLSWLVCLGIGLTIICTPLLQVLRGDILLPALSLLRALALPFVPLLMMVNIPVVWPWCGILAFFAPLLMFAGSQIALGKTEGAKRGMGIGIMVCYLALLMFLPVAGIVMHVL